MDVILSIKPKYVEKILSGEKQYEFRNQHNFASKVRLLAKLTGRE